MDTVSDCISGLSCRNSWGEFSERGIVTDFGFLAFAADRARLSPEGKMCDSVDMDRCLDRCIYCQYGGDYDRNHGNQWARVWWAV